MPKQRFSKTISDINVLIFMYLFKSFFLDFISRIMWNLGKEKDAIY